MVWNSIGPEAKVLDSLPMIISVAEPIYSGDAIVDFRLVWVNSETAKTTLATKFIGQKYSEFYADWRESGFLEELIEIRETKGTLSRFRQARTDSGMPVSSYRILGRWNGDRVIFTTKPLGSAAPTGDDVFSAALIITQLLPKLPISYSISGDQGFRLASTVEFEKNMAWNLTQITPQSLSKRLHRDDVAEFETWMALPLEHKVMPLVIRAINGAGSERWIEIWTADLANHVSGAQEEFLLIRDINELKELQAESAALKDQLEDQFDLLSRALNAAPNGFAIWRVVRGENGEIQDFILDFINDAGAAATGKSPESLVNHSVDEVVGETQSKGLFDLFKSAVMSQEQQVQVVQINSHAGWVGAYENRAVPFGDDRVVTSFRDVSAEQSEAKRLVWLAEHDHLTGLPNRRQLETTLSNALTRARERGSKLGFVYIDIDDFKGINDRYGHDAGDRLLVHFVERLQTIAPEASQIARISGDEFAIIFPDLADQAELNAYMLRIFESMARGFNHDMPELRITCSAGCVISDGQEPWAEIMRIADRQMYKVKNSGKNNFSVTSVS